MTDPVHFEITQTHPPLAVVTLSGELDMTTAPGVRARTFRLIADGCPHLIIDLSGVTFCDSTGLGTLIGILRRVGREGGSLRLVAVSDRLARLLHTTGMDAVLNIHTTVAVALGAQREQHPAPADEA